MLVHNLAVGGSFVSVPMATTNVGNGSRAEVAQSLGVRQLHLSKPTVSRMNQFEALL